MLGRVNSEPDFRCPSIVLTAYLNLSGLHTGCGDSWNLLADTDKLIARSEGIEHIWVNGTPTRRDGTDLEGATPGILVDSC